MPGNKAPMVMGGGAPCPPRGCWGSTVRPHLSHGCWENGQGPSGTLCSHHSSTAPTPAPFSLLWLASLAPTACLHGWWQTCPKWPKAPFPKVPDTHACTLCHPDHLKQSCARAWVVGTGSWWTVSPLLQVQLSPASSRKPSVITQDLPFFLFL